MTDQNEQSPEQADVSRRDTLKLAAAIAAFGVAMGVRPADSIAQGKTEGKGEGKGSGKGEGKAGGKGEGKGGGKGEGKAGGKADPTPTQDYGFMYGRSFEDPDGHIWEVMWMDPTAIPAGEPAEAEA